MVEEISLKKAVDDNFTRYAGSVILDRAICDARDMLKPSARMLMYSQYEQKNTHEKPALKSQGVVGQAMKDFYSHGDSSCYATYMRMAKPFAMRYPLEECQGNSGTIITTGDEAASRYTQLRLAPVSSYLFDGIRKDTIDKWHPNFDDTKFFPSVLPTVGYYNICNGTTGIGVSLASSIPQFNLREVNAALIKLLKNPNVSFEEIYCAPDFATGAILINEKEVKEALKNGTGKACRLRSVLNYDLKQNAIRVSEVPYGVYTGTITEQLIKIMNEDPECGIDSYNDGSGQSPDYIIYLSKGANPSKVMARLLKETSLEYFFGVNMVMLEDGRFPKTFTWKQALESYLKHAKICKRREYEYDLKQLKQKENILDGLSIAIASIDKVIKLIRGSDSTKDAHDKLVSEIGLNDEQAKAVLEMKLSRLAHLEAIKIENDLNQVRAEISRIADILENEDRFNEELIKIFEDVSKKFGDARRTKLLNMSDEEAEAVAQDIVITISHEGFIKKNMPQDFKTQRKNGKGLKRQDNVAHVISATTKDSLMVFSSIGKAYSIDLDKLNIEFEMLEFSRPDEKFVTCAKVSPNSKDEFVWTVSKNGLIKKTPLSEYSAVKRKAGENAVSIREGDALVSIFIGKNENIMVFTKKGMAIKFKGDDVAPTGRGASGVKSITMAADDEVIAAFGCANMKYILTCFTDGTGRKTEISEFPLQMRAGKGLSNTKDATACVVPIPNNECLVNIIGKKNVITIKAEDITESGRSTKGTKLIKEDNIVKAYVL